jgi:hypothetical protein
MKHPRCLVCGVYTRDGVIVCRDCALNGREIYQRWRECHPLPTPSRRS